MALLYLLLTYLLAAVPFGVVLTTLYGSDVDLRPTGSGNIGATNVARVFGWRMAVAVLALDLLKGLVPVLLAPWFGLDGIAWGSIVALVAFAGHCWPVYLELRGGKGVATSAGAMLALAPIPTAIAAVAWGGTLAASGRSSLSSLLAALVLVIACAFLAPAALPATLLLALGIALTHTPNIRRLMRGEESAVVPPVRWGRQQTRPISAEEVLSQGPAGGATGDWGE